MDDFVVSARKYRPATFDTVVGQQAITSTLKNAIRNQTLAQAFLFCGPRGVGKTTCARILARTINCLNPTSETEACNECESCKAFNNNTSFNIYELDAASNNSVDDIRNLVEQVRIPPQVGKYKVYIIDEVHMLSQAAFNAFLKTLEEPPAYAKFILATTEKHKIIPTILSRCQIFDFKRITNEDIQKHLKYVADNEKIRYEDEALHVIAQKADGALRDALSIFDQMVSFSNKNITYKSVIENLNILDFEYFFKTVDSILAGDLSSLLLTLNEIIDNGFDAQHFINGLASHMRNLLVAKDPTTAELIEASGKLCERYIQQSANCTLPMLFDALKIANECDINYRTSSNKRLLIELGLMRMCAKPTQANAEHQIVQSPKPQPRTNTAVEEPKPVKQVAEPITQPEKPKMQPAPQPESKPTQQPAATEHKPTTEATVKKVHRGTISISHKSQDAPKSDENNIIEKNTPFTQAQLEEAWKEYVEANKEKHQGFAIGIGKYTPELRENSIIHFKIDNAAIVGDNDLMTDYHNFLKNKLNNTKITLEPEVTIIASKVEAYTDKDKFMKMAEKQPLLFDIQKELNLQPEL